MINNYMLNPNIIALDLFVKGKERLVALLVGPDRLEI